MKRSLSILAAGALVASSLTLAAAPGNAVAEGTSVASLAESTDSSSTRWVVKVKKATVGTKQVTFTWTKAPTAKADWGEKSLSYQIRYRVKGTTKWTKVKVSLSKASYTIKKLKKGKKYQIGIRVKLQVTGGDMGIFYGPWSKTLTSGKVK